MSTHVRLYIDGKLEPLSGGKSEFVPSLVSGPDSELSSFSLGGSGSFEGWMDEFYLFEAATPPATVLKLYQLGAQLDGNRGDGQ